MAARQIPLPLKGSERYRLSSWVPGGNQKVYRHTCNILAGSESGNTCYWGRSGTGKSHLLQAVSAAASGRDQTAAYIPLKLFARLEPRMLDGMEAMHIVCIDDLQAIVGCDEWEMALFNLFNRAREDGALLLMSTDDTPAGLRYNLPDLVSRLTWDHAFQISPLGDDDLMQAMRIRADERMFHIPDEVLRFLLRRLPRDTHSLFAVLDRLDRAGLEKKQKITIPLVRELYGFRP